ncbi:hypothetical protein GF325_06265, partial [Candidatus Bathyarchaeota archaeon]|nr:hypothetical protein [Candidatus Bathyarchaeota archaeon]
ISAINLLMQFYGDNFNDKAYDLLKVVENGGIRLQQLVENLLDILRLNSDMIDINKELNDLGGMIMRTIQEHSFQIESRDLSIEIDIPDGFKVRVDKIRFEQVLSNLVSNAVKNTPPRGSIYIYSEIPENGSQVTIIVEDTGVGLTKEEIDQLFSFFGKIERYGKGMDIITEGTGLGLYITKNIIEQHGGSITADSDGRGKGSKFTISIPIDSLVEESPE